VVLLKPFQRLMFPRQLFLRAYRTTTSAQQTSTQTGDEPYERVGPMLSTGLPSLGLFGKGGWFGFGFAPLERISVNLRQNGFVTVCVEGQAPDLIVNGKNRNVVDLAEAAGGVCNVPG
jgi:hypothetical protein